ncbi:hypothetical protein G6F31_019601 [Rhizopus arrhizus]|nr:hypothetical protein G6F24_016920 [Rhizopus arrhizus]KAG0923216.1 hypothetical protein G6F31_019601 [Rhizopus arrhizus]
MDRAGSRGHRAADGQHGHGAGTGAAAVRPQRAAGRVSPLGCAACCARRGYPAQCRAARRAGAGGRQTRCRTGRRHPHCRRRGGAWSGLTAQ